MKNENKLFSKEFLILFTNCVGWGKLFAPNKEGLKAFADFYWNYVKQKTMSADRE